MTCAHRLALAIAALALSAPGARAQEVPPIDSVRRLAAAGHASAALALGRATARAHPDDPAAHAAAAIGAMAAQDFDGAVDAADRMLALAPEVSTWQLVYGQAYLSHAREHPNLAAIRRVKRGRTAVERAIALDPDNLDARYTLLQFLIQAPGIAGGSLEKAERQAREIERRNRRRGLRARLEIAVAKDAPDAIRDIVVDALSVLRDTPAPADDLLGGLFLAAGSLRDDRLREDLTARLYATRPEDPVAAYHRARLWIIEDDRPADAERLLLGYLAVPERRGGAASRAGAHWRLAQLYQRMDRKDHAREQYRMAASLDPRLRPGSRLPARLEAQL